MRVVILMGALVALATSGCAATKFLGATQVGGADDATWVFVHTDDNVGVNGVYRCHDQGGVVTCRKAKIIK